MFISALVALLLPATTTTAYPVLAKRNIGGVRFCEQANWGGYCWYGIVPLGECWALNSFKGNVLSFRPDDGTTCFLMQRQCDSNDQFASFESDDVELGSDLTKFDWIADAESFMCWEVQAANATDEDEAI